MNRIIRHHATATAKDDMMRRMTMSDGSIVLFEARTENIFKLFRTRLFVCKLALVATPLWLLDRTFDDLERRKMTSYVSFQLNSGRFIGEDDEGAELLKQAAGYLLLGYACSYAIFTTIKRTYMLV